MPFDSPIAILRCSAASQVWAQAEEKTVYASVVEKDDAPVRGCRRASSSCVKTMSRARCCARQPRPSRCRSRCWSTRARRSIDHISSISVTALRAFFKQMGGKHEICAHRLRRASDRARGLTRDTARLEKGIGFVFARQGSGTYILDAIVETADACDAARRRAPHRRLRRTWSGVQRAAPPDRSRRAPRIGRHASFAHAEQTGHRREQPRGAGAQMMAGRWARR